MPPWFGTWLPSSADTPEATMSLFGDETEILSTKKYVEIEVEKWTNTQMLNHEREMLGVYFSGHPLARYQRHLNKILKGKTIAPNVRGIVSPATVQTYKIALQEGLIDIFIDAGFCVTNPTCGACLGMSNGVLAEGEVCASTTNRNFNGRMGKGGMIHLMSPATAAASAIKGFISNSELFEE